MKKEFITIHTDGGSRGNPGPAACAFVVEDSSSEIYKESKYLGKQTNNFAEYGGVILALNWLVKRNFSNVSVFFYLDSELVVKQINGAYKVRDENLRKLFSEVISLIKKTGIDIIFKNVPREKNKIADFLVNKELDKNE